MGETGADKPLATRLAFDTQGTTTLSMAETSMCFRTSAHTGQMKFEML
jgi:hypothetical protein